ncbi:hypothetical protein [Dongia sp.]|uniref:hypothetical protein n=1 Tax=Dongia sp. TaxID=1977262 RepID=UPI003750E2AB
MTLRDLAHIALRIGAVIVIVDILVSLPMAFTAARYYAPVTFNQRIFDSAIFPLAISFCCAVLIYGFAEEIADRLVLRGKTEVEILAPADLSGLEQTAVAILGLYFLIMGLADVVHFLVRYLTLQLAIGPASSILVSPDTANFGGTLFRVIVGGFLFLNGDAFVRMRRKIRAKRGIAGEEGSAPEAYS